MFCTICTELPSTVLWYTETFYIIVHVIMYNKCCLSKLIFTLYCSLQPDQQKVWFSVLSDIFSIVKNTNSPGDITYHHIMLQSPTILCFVELVKFMPCHVDKLYTKRSLMRICISYTLNTTSMVCTYTQSFESSIIHYCQIMNLYFKVICELNQTIIAGVK